MSVDRSLAAVRMAVKMLEVNAMQRDRRRRLCFGDLGILSLVTQLALTGCSHAPEYSIFGSFFPVWIFCSAAGLLLAMGARAAIARTALAEHLASPVLLYLGMATFFACVLWLVFYS